MIAIKILGPGCAKCKQAEVVVREVLAQSQVEATVEKVEDIQAMMAYNVLQTPVLVINERVVIKGRVPTAAEVRQLIAG